MNNFQLYLAIGVPILFNGVIFVAMATSFNARISDLQSQMQARFTGLEKVMDARFEAAQQALLRVEGVLDARLSSLEARLKHFEER